MKVTLIDFTGKGQPDPEKYAASLLAFTKGTRLQMTAGGFEEFQKKPWSEIETELKYMANTIPSSWEFVDYTFQIEGVTRAFTHQFVRTRTASFAQQTMRVLNVSEGPGWDYYTGPSITGEQQDGEAVDGLLNSIYSHTMDGISEAYKSLIAHGAKVEDARGILPTNILTNITVKMNMRTFVEMVRKRSSSRTQGEYRDVLLGMRWEVEHRHSWIKFFIERDADRAIADLERLIQVSNESEETRTHMIKLLDQLRAYL